MELLIKLKINMNKGWNVYFIISLFLFAIGHTFSSASLVILIPVIFFGFVFIGIGVYHMIKNK
jgi:hypothetical protein